MAETQPRKTLPGESPRQMGGMQAALRARKDDFLRASIAIMASEEHEPEIYNMNLEELKSKSTAELRDIYNGMADRQIKRFESRVEAEKRTAERLKEAGKWEGDLPGSGGKSAKGKSAAKGAAKHAEKAKGGKGKGKAAAAPAAAKKGAAKASDGEPKQKGAPKQNYNYKAIDHDRRMNAESARTKVFNALKELAKGRKNGIDRETIENHFAEDETVNVKAALDYLVKQGMAEIIE